MTNQELSRTIDALADYAVRKDLICPEDRTWAVNCLLAALKADEFAEGGQPAAAPLADLWTA